jgi:hypothetical protein
MIALRSRRAAVQGILPLTGIVVLVCLLPASLALHKRSSTAPSSESRLASLPHTILWAWERPEDLRFLPLGRVGVSFLAATVTLSADTVTVQPRRNDLQTAPGTPLVACVRIEVDLQRPPLLSPEQAAAASAAVAGSADLAGVSVVQVDFDATVSERTFYAGLLRDLRRRLPAGMPLSVTALASWCMDDPWIAGLPVDEAVPMLFRMGPDTANVRALLAQGRDFSLPVCRESIGISTDERLADLPARRRRYIFNPEGWSASALDSLVAEKRPR